MLSRNAKLYLLATGLQGFAFSIWGVIFYLYLNLKDVGFQADFISNLFTVGALATGIVALPAGLFCERIGPKRAIVVSFAANLANLVQIVVLEPSLLLLASLASGFIGTLGWVASAPFMMANSREEERTYLFSFDWGLMIVMGVVGSYLGGAMPDLFNAYLGLAVGKEGAPAGYRVALIISVLLALSAVVPILMTKEERAPGKQRIADLLSLKNIKSRGIIIRFMVPTALVGFGAGFIVPLLNLFFRLKFEASTETIGIMSSLASFTLSFGTLIAPPLASKLGKVRSVVLCQYLSMPFIMLMTMAPSLPFAATAYIIRNALMNMAGPINTTLQMELVTETERATTNGLMVMADNIPRAITASISGEMMTGSDFFTPFAFMTGAYFIASTLFFVFFRKAEARKIKMQQEEVS